MSEKRFEIVLIQDGKMYQVLLTRHQRMGFEDNLTRIFRGEPITVLEEPICDVEVNNISDSDK